MRQHRRPPVRYTSAVRAVRNDCFARNFHRFLFIAGYTMDRPGTFASRALSKTGEFAKREMENVGNSVRAASRSSCRRQLPTNSGVTIVR